MTWDDSLVVGVVLQSEGPRHILFLASRSFNLTYGSIVGLRVDSEQVVLCFVEEISTYYHLNDPKRFFAGFAAEDRLNQVVTGGKKSPLFSQEVKARVLGTYKIGEHNSGLCLVSDCVDRFSPQPLQSVFKVGFECAKGVFGLDRLGMCLGKMQHPFVGRVEVPFSSLKRHTLISGVTGSGKSRLAGILSKLYALGGGCVTIIDPHDEYSNLFAADSNFKDIFRYEIAPCAWSSRKWLNSNYNEQKIIESKRLILSEKNLTASSLCRLLPFASSQQQQEIHNFFEYASNINGSLIRNLRDIFQDELRSLPEQNMRGKYDRVGRQEVLQALIAKLTFKYNKELDAYRLSDKIYLSAKSQKWQEVASGKISIICGDYNRTGIGKRFLSALFEQFLRVSSSSGNVPQLVVVEEAHQIFKFEDEDIRIVLNQLLREARKFNITLLLVTQNYSDIPEDMRYQFQNIFSFRQVSDDNLKYLNEKSCMVSLFGGKSEFIMQTESCSSLSDSSSSKRINSV